MKRKNENYTEWKKRVEKESKFHNDVIVDIIGVIACAGLIYVGGTHSDWVCGLLGGGALLGIMIIHLIYIILKEKTK